MLSSYDFRFGLLLLAIENQCCSLFLYFAVAGFIGFVFCVFSAVTALRCSLIDGC